MKNKKILYFSLVRLYNFFCIRNKFFLQWLQLEKDVLHLFGAFLVKRNMNGKGSAAIVRQGYSPAMLGVKY